MSSCESPSCQQMYQSKNHWRKAKSSQRRRKFMSAVKGVSHLSRRAKRRLYCKWQLWMWRKLREKSHFWMFRGKRRSATLGAGSDSNLSLKPQSQENHKVLTININNRERSPVGASTPLGAPQQEMGGAIGLQNGLLRWSESDSLSETHRDLSSIKVPNVPPVPVSQTTRAATVSSQNSKTPVPLREIPEPSKRRGAVGPSRCADGSCSKQEARRPPHQLSPVPPHQSRTTTKCPDERLGSEKTTTCPDVNPNTLIRDIQDFLDAFYKRYGSFIPLCKSDILKHLKRKFNSDFSDRKHVIFSEAVRHQAETIQKPVPSFRVVYKKHILTLEDLWTLADQNWLNDQVMNMYGELIMESSHYKVHFLNSFFHRQLMTKGYDGVKRWTKQVDLFSKRLLLVPVHLEVHWCLVTADVGSKKICLYDSQGHALQKVARNILKYMMTEAREKNQSGFEDGWTVSYDEKVPQQTNENDCGVFVLEYSRCLALDKPFQFSQKDIPKIRKRIYKELCDCQLREQD